MRSSDRSLVPLVTILLAAAPGPMAAQTTYAAVERDARRAQRDFERFRRDHLPVAAITADVCDVSFGRLCTGTDVSDTPPETEDDEVRGARNRLRESLRELDGYAPASEFIIGQQVRYALEAQDAGGARSAAGACRATRWWCLALSGLAAHAAGDESAASAAFDSALDAMPAAQRCDWLDVRDWLPRGMHVPDATPPCKARRALARLVFWLAAPTLTWHARAARDEFLARRTMEQIVAGTAIPREIHWGPDIAEVRLRFGWPIRFSRQAQEGGSLLAPAAPVVEDLPSPSFSLVPDRHALESPLEARAGDWALQHSVRAPMLYAPGWIKAIAALPVQIARFRRGSRMLIVAAYDASGALDGASADRDAAILLASGPDSALGEAHERAAPPMGALALEVPARQALAAVEVIDSARAIVARWRAAVAPLPGERLISELLVGTTDSASPPRTLGAFLPHALGRLRVAPGATLALYWEQYATASMEQPLTVELRLVPLTSGFMHGLGKLFGLGGAAPVMSIRWQDRGGREPSSARTLRVAIPDVPPGRYRLEIVVAGDETLGRAASEIDVESPHDASPRS